MSALPVHSTEAFSPERGAREGATKVMIVVTDGESHDGEELPDALKECEDRNITRYAIAVSLSDKCARARKIHPNSCVYRTFKNKHSRCVKTDAP